MNADKWEFYEDKAGKWRWRRTALNGNRVGAATEGYERRADCEANARRNGYGSGPDGDVSGDKWEFYKDKAGEHRWRRTAPNGNRVGAACEGYSKRADCLANAQRHGYAGE